MVVVRIAAAAALLAAASASGASSPGELAPAHAAKQAEKADPDRQICKSRGVVGSRLKRVRECATAQQWEDMELQERLGLARKQINGDPGCNGGGNCGVQRGGKDTPW